MRLHSPFRPVYTRERKLKILHSAPWQDPETPDERSYLERLFFARESSRHANYDANTLEHGQEQRPGLPKVSRECLVAEIKCYGSYILPTLLVFVVLVLAISLTIFFHYKP